MEPTDIAAVQFEPMVGEPEANHGRIAELADRLPDGTEVAVFPEMCVTGYDLEVAATEADRIPGDLTDPVVDIAADADLDLIVGLPERDGEALYNTLVHAGPGGVEAVYRKQRLWGDEAGAFDRGAAPTVTQTAAGTAGLLVCYDLNFPELALRYAEAGVDFLAVSSAWRTSFLEDWRLLLRARALDGTCYAVGSNHIGDQRGREHAGHSLIAGPTGTVIDEAGTAPGTTVATIDESALAEARERNPVHRDR